MKILHVLQYHFDDLLGGIQRYVKDLSFLQARSGHDVEIFCSGKKGLSKQGNPRVQKFFGINILRTPICFGMIKEFMSCRYDVVHIHAQFPIIGELIAILCKIKKIPVVTTYHNEPDLSNKGFPKNFLRVFWERFLVGTLLGYSDKIIVTTREFFNSSRFLKRFDKKVSVVPCGVFMRETKHLPRSRTVLYVGRIKPEKGLHTLVEAIFLLRNYRKSDVNLLIVGEATRDDEREHLVGLKALVHDLKLDASIEFLGKVSDEELEKIYKKSSVLVLPSLTRLEAFGIVQLEAMAFAVPVIVSDIPGPRSVLKHVSLTFSPGDAKALATAIEKIVSDQLLVEKMTKKGKELLATKYSWHIVYEQINQIYQQAIRDCLYSHIDSEDKGDQI